MGLRYGKGAVVPHFWELLGITFFLVPVLITLLQTWLTLYITIKSWSWTQYVWTTAKTHYESHSHGVGLRQLATLGGYPWGSVLSRTLSNVIQSEYTYIANLSTMSSFTAQWRHLPFYNNLNCCHCHIFDGWVLKLQWVTVVQGLKNKQQDFNAKMWTSAILTLLMACLNDFQWFEWFPTIQSSNPSSHSNIQIIPIIPIISIIPKFLSFQYSNHPTFQSIQSFRSFQSFQCNLKDAI